MSLVMARGPDDATSEAIATTRHGGPSANPVEWARSMHKKSAIALLLVIAFVGATFTPCRPLPLTSSHGVRDATDGGVHWNAGSDPAPSTAVGRAGAEPNRVVLVGRCPCGCDERPPVAGSSPGLGIALISRAPSPAALPGDQELCSVISFLPTSPPSGIDTVPRSA